MTDQQILTKAIQKAQANGWVFFKDCTLLPVKDWIIPNSITVWNSFLDDKVYIPQQCAIFNHDFAKALWPELPDYKAEDETDYRWQYHLQQMVIAEDPIKYLGDNLPA